MSDDEDLFEVFNDHTAPSCVNVPAPTPAVPAASPLRTVNINEPHAPTTETKPAIHTPPIVEAAPTPAVRTTLTHADLMRLATTTTTGTSTTTPTPTAGSSLNVVAPPAGANPGGMAIMASSNSSHNNNNTAADGTNGTSGLATPDPVKTYLQKESGIRVKRATTSLLQLPLFTAGAPITAFAAVHRWMSSSAAKADEVLPNTCIGTVVRKTDPKMGSRNAYAVMTLWDMQGGSPTAPHELAFLVCGAAFEHVFSKAPVGSVVAISQFARMRGNTSSSSSSNTQSNGSLLRLSNLDAFRLLGYAADLGTCESVSKKTGERCTALVNTRQTKHCVYHLSDIRKVASSSASATTASRAPYAVTGKSSPATITGATPVMKGGALTTHLNFSSRPAASGPAVGPASHQPFPSSSSSTVARTPLLKPALVESKQVLKKQQSNLFTVRGKSGLPTHAVGNGDATVMDGGGIYTGVRSGTALPVTGLMSDAVAQSYPSAQSLGVSTRGRDALAAARLQQDQERTRQLLRRVHSSSSSAQVTPGTKRPRDDTPGVGAAASTVSSTPETRLRAVEALKQQFAPLAPVGGAAASSATSSAGRRGDDGKKNLLVGAVSRAIAQGTIPVNSSTQPVSRATPRAVAAAAIVSAASTAKSSLDHLRVQAERDRLEAYLDGEIVREKAREVLESITEQAARGTYCFACKNWYLKLPKSCVEAQHRTESRETKKRFIQCTQCQHKTFILGESTVAAKVLPVCPQCKHHTTWISTSAAPLVPEVSEDVHPY